jgi:REP element-mobilizing transposase RayT
MPSVRVPKELNDRFYFCTFTVRRWAKVFSNDQRFGLLADSISFCQAERGLRLFGYVFMPNHLHLILQSPDVSGYIRDFKRFTAKRLLDDVLKNDPTSATIYKGKNGLREFWQRTNMPILLENDAVLEQKLNYIHRNPVKAGLVKRSEEWKWSSAGFYFDGKEGKVKVDRF